MDGRVVFFFCTTAGRLLSCRALLLGGADGRWTVWQTEGRLSASRDSQARGRERVEGDEGCFKNKRRGEKDHPTRRLDKKEVESPIDIVADACAIVLPSARDLTHTDRLPGIKSQKTKKKRPSNNPVLNTPYGVIFLIFFLFSFQ